MAEPQLSYNPNPTEPKLRLPDGACDAHFHVFGPQAQFAFAEKRTYTPADAPKEKLFDLHDFLLIERGVVVQSGAHGFDNAAAADLIAAKPKNYLGVALLPPDVAVAEMKRLHEQGFRGVRFNYVKHLGTAVPIDDVMRLATRMAGIGWHLQLHMESNLIAQMTPALQRSPVPVVIDHMGRIDASRGLDQPEFRHLLALLEDKRIWVKVSGVERASRQGTPYADAVPFARKLVQEFGDRTLWGTDWPHPNLAPIPDDGVLVDLLAEIAPSDAQRQALLVDNPQRFYKFS
jgi:2-pyrone-4,6-dicarboxylate lactonase